MKVVLLAGGFGSRINEVPGFNPKHIGSGTPRILKEYLMKIGELAGMQDKVGIGIRPDDGIKYDFTMFDTTPLKEAIGDYVSTPFEEGIKKTINWLKEQQ